MSEFSFDELARQSPRGIVINYGVLLFRVLKSFWVLIPLFLSKNIGDKIGYILLVLAILAVLLLLVAFIQYWYFKYKIEGDYFILNQGMIFKKKTAIPIERIQSVNFKQNIIHQLINITQVEIQTAGAKEVEVSIKAISHEKAEALKSRLENFKENSAELQSIDKEIKEELPGELIYKLSILDLLKVSFSENHVRSFFWILALVFSFGYQLEDIVKEWNFADEAIEFVIKNQSAISGSLLVVGFAFFIGLVISVVVSFVRVFLMHFEQNVVQRNDGIQVSEGLFTKREDVLKLKKIQYTVIVTNPIKQWFGIQTVKIKQAGSAKTKRKKLVQLVGVKNEFLGQLNQMFFHYESKDDSETFTPAKYYLFRMFAKTGIFLLALNVFFYFNQFSNWNWVLANLLLIPFSILLVIMKYRKTYFSFEGKTLTVGDGKIGTITTVIDYFKTQNVRYSQSYIQKKRGVATLKLQTASGVINLPCLHQKDARIIQQRIVSEVQSTTRDWI